MLELNRAEIVVELEAMVTTRLFSSHQWPGDWETLYVAVHQKFMKMGLMERISSDTWRNTPLGMEFDVDLFALTSRAPTPCSTCIGTVGSVVQPIL